MALGVSLQWLGIVKRKKNINLSCLPVARFYEHMRYQLKSYSLFNFVIVNGILWTLSIILFSILSFPDLLCSEADEDGVVYKKRFVDILNIHKNKIQSEFIE